MNHTKNKTSWIYLALIIATFTVGTVIDSVVLNRYGWAVGGLGAILAAVIAICCMYRFTKERVSIKSLVNLLRIARPQLPTAWDGLLVFIMLLAAVSIPLVVSSGIPKNITTQLFLYALSSAIIPPIIEELLDRGFIQTSLERLRYPSLLVIMVSSVIFSFSHYPINPDIIPVAMIAGLIFGFITLRTKSVLIPFVLHGIWNFMVTILI